MTSSWDSCSFLTCSVLPVRMACQCECPFCFSRSSVSSLEAASTPWSDTDLRAHYRWAARRGATRMVVTGGGEPLLRPDDCMRAIRLATEVFAEIALFTNGARLTSALAGELRSSGLSYLCWSRHATGDDDNRRLMGAAAPPAEAVLAAAEAASLPVRATCVMNREGVASAEEARRYIQFFTACAVRQFTFKHTYVASERSVFSSSPANEWSRRDQVQDDPFVGCGEVVGSLPWGPQIRKIGEVQVCHYFEPTPQWELAHRLARSSNLLSDGSVYASLEDDTSLLHRLGLGDNERFEPVVDPARLAEAIPPGDVEGLRALLPTGYRVAAEAYRAAVGSLCAEDLSSHYFEGQTWLRATFAPALIERLGELSGGEWDLRGWDVFAAGSDVDLITHIVEAVASAGQVRLYPGDWYGFLVGGTHDSAIAFDSDTAGDLACLCVPSVRNGHLTANMVDFLARSPVQLLNINLFPTLTPQERRATAGALRPLLPSALLSVSFSRGFGLTASQLGVLLVPPGHPWSATYRRQWEWFSYFYNALAARAFLAIDLPALASVDGERRRWASAWLDERGLPDVATGSYYVRSFRPDGPVVGHLRPLVRDGVLRCCLKPVPT